MCWDAKKLFQTKFSLRTCNNKGRKDVTALLKTWLHKMNVLNLRRIIFWRMFMHIILEYQNQPYGNDSLQHSISLFRKLYNHRILQQLRRSYFTLSLISNCWRKLLSLLSFMTLKELINYIFLKGYFNI